MGGQTHRPGRSQASPDRRPGHTAAPAQPRRAGETRWRPARPLARRHHQRQGPQAAAAHPDRRRHDAARARPEQSTDRGPLAHRRRQRTHHGPAVASRTRQTQPVPGSGDGPPARPDHRHPRPGRTPQRRRADHRPRQAVRRRRRPVDPPRLQDPSTQPLRPRRTSVAQAAGRLGCSTGVVYYWLKTGQLTARRGAGNRLCIPWTSQIEADCRARIAQSGHLTPAARRTKPRHGR